jgi:hypothetical protein
MTGADKLDEADQSGMPGIVRVDRPVRALFPERGSFEAAMAKAGYHTPPSLHPDGTYRDTCYSAGWDAWQAARPKRADVQSLVNLSAKLIDPDTLRKLWQLEEASGRTLGRRALSAALEHAAENLRLAAIELARVARAL